jgi:hypothetical protein
LWVLAMCLPIYFVQAILCLMGFVQLAFSCHVH